MRSRCSGVVAEVARALLAKHAYDLDVAAAAFHADPAAYSFHHSAQAPLAGPAHILGEKEPEPELEPLEDEPVSGVPSVDELRQQRAAFFARQNRPPTTLLTVSTSGSTSTGHALAELGRRVQARVAAAGLAAAGTIRSTASGGGGGAGRPCGRCWRAGRGGAAPRQARDGGQPAGPDFRPVQGAAAWTAGGTGGGRSGCCRPTYGCWGGKEGSSRSRSRSCECVRQTRPIFWCDRCHCSNECNLIMSLTTCSACQLRLEGQSYFSHT